MLELEKLLSHKSHIIWDWNGTLLDDLSHCATIVRGMLQAYGMKVITEDEHRRLFRMPVVHFYHALGFDLAKVPFETLAHDFVDKYREGVRDLKLFEGTEELLRLMKAQGKKQSVLSAARQRELDELLVHFKIREYFDHVFGLNDAFAHSKIDRGKELMKLWGAPKENVILVGDMDHDADVAKELGIDIVLLGDGHQHYENLRLLHPQVIPSRYTCR